jgi:hypothetical protein
MTTYLNILKSVFTILIFSTLLFSCPGETSEKEHNDSEQTEMNQDQELIKMEKMEKKLIKMEKMGKKLIKMEKKIMMDMMDMMDMMQR